MMFGKSWLVACRNGLRERRRPHLTLLARCALLMLAEVLANALIWIVTAIVFTRGGNRGGDDNGNAAGANNNVLGLALIAWTTGLRHGLDADHISAIDNATRRIVSVPQHILYADGRAVLRRRRPVTVGLFFSLGHSTIVFATIVAIAISASVADGLDTFGDVGGIIGAAVSGSFLFLIGCINSVILYRTWRRLQASKRSPPLSLSEAAAVADAEDKGESDGGSRPPKKSTASHFNGIMTRLAMPLLRTVDRPWKLYPVGVLFGLGFDTASSIALLSVSVIALQNTGGPGTAGNASVILLSLLFTAGMTIVDSADSCLMIWAYAPERTQRRGWQRLTPIERRQDADEVVLKPGGAAEADGVLDAEKRTPSAAKGDDTCGHRMNSVELDVEATASASAAAAATGSTPADANARDRTTAKASVLPHVQRFDVSASRISLVLTLLSILVAFAISIIVLLGLIGDECARCTAAADKQEESGNGGLEGRWWLAWRRANDSSGYVGAGIVGAFAVCVLVYFGGRWALAHRRRRQQLPPPPPPPQHQAAPLERVSEDVDAASTSSSTRPPRQEADPPLAATASAPVPEPGVLGA